MRHDYGFQPTPSQFPPDRAPVSKVPANRNDDGYNPTDPDYQAGKIEWEARQAIRELFMLKGPEKAEKHVAKIIEDLGWR